MQLSRRGKLGTGVVVVALAAGAGGAVAASHFGSSGIDSQAVITDAANQLGVDPSNLSAALKQALSNQIDALVSSGRLTKAQGDAIKQRIQSGQAPLFRGGSFGFRRSGFGRAAGLGALDVASSYLGVSAADLRSALASGKTLADVAKEHGKTADGLVAALVDDAKKKLDTAVSAGRLTQAQEDSLLGDLKQRITDAVNGTRSGRPFQPGFRIGGDHMWRGRRSFDRPLA
jgi:uncharacterized protein YidB (DUF937 family)